MQQKKSVKGAFHSAISIGLNEQKSSRLPRFTQQRDKCSCGPVAILNYYKWLGIRYTYKHIKKIKEDLGWPFFGGAENGVPAPYMSIYILKFLSEYLVDVKVPTDKISGKKALKKLLKHLKQDRAAILCHPVPEQEEWHYTLMLPFYEKQKVMVVNFSDEATLHFLSYKQLYSIFKLDPKGITYWVLANRKQNGYSVDKS